MVSILYKLRARKGRVRRASAWHGSAWRAMARNSVARLGLVWSGGLRSGMALLLMVIGSHAAQISVAWDANPNVVEYVVLSGPASGDYDRVAFTTNTTFTATNLATGTLYKFGIVALGSDNGSDIATLTALPYESIMVLEWAPSPTGPWEAKASNTFNAVPGFYRGKVVIR